MAHYFQNCVLFTLLALLIALNRVIARNWKKTQNKLGHYVQNCALSTFLAQLMALKEGTTGVEKIQNQLTFKHTPSSGEILN